MLVPALSVVLAAALTIGTPPASADASSARLRLTGEVGELYPGVPRTMDVAVRNPLGHAVVIGSVSGHPERGAPGCSPSQLAIATGRPSVRIPARSTGTVPLDVQLRAGAPDACQGVTFLLGLHAHARVVSASSVTDDGGVGPGGPQSGGAGPLGSMLDELPLTGLGLALILLAGWALLAAGASLREHARPPAS